MNAGQKMEVVRRLSNVLSDQQAIIDQLESRVEKTPRGSYRLTLEASLNRARDHAKRVRQRLSQLDRGHTGSEGLTPSLGGKPAPSRPDDVAGTWLMIHQVSGHYMIIHGETVTEGRWIVAWHNHPLKTDPKVQGYLWHLEKAGEGEYRIRAERPRDNGDHLYLEADPETGKGQYNRYPRMKKRADNDRQLWKVVAVTCCDDAYTYAMESKAYPGYALGRWKADDYVINSPTYGAPTIQHAWRLSEPPAEAAT